MTPGEWIGTVSGGLGLLTGMAALGRILVTHGTDRQRLKALEDWQAAKSIDRSELDAVIADHVALEQRVTCTEGDVKDVAAAMSEIRIALARIPEQLNTQDKVMELRFTAVNHSIANVKQMLAAYAPRGVPIPD